MPSQSVSLKPNPIPTRNTAGRLRGSCRAGAVPCARGSGRQAGPGAQQCSRQGCRAAPRPVACLLRTRCGVCPATTHRRALRLDAPPSSDAPLDLPASLFAAGASPLPERQPPALPSLALQALTVHWAPCCLPPWSALCTATPAWKRWTTQQRRCCPWRWQTLPCCSRPANRSWLPAPTARQRCVGHGALHAVRGVHCKVWAGMVSCRVQPLLAMRQRPSQPVVPPTGLVALAVNGRARGALPLLSMRSDYLFQPFPGAQLLFCVFVSFLSPGLCPGRLFGACGAGGRSRQPGPPLAPRLCQGPQQGCGGHAGCSVCTMTVSCPEACCATQTTSDLQHMRTGRNSSVQVCRYSLGWLLPAEGQLVTGPRS